MASYEQIAVRPPEAKPNPADPLAKLPAAPDVERSDLPMPIPNEPPKESSGAPTPALPPLVETPR